MVKKLVNETDSALGYAKTFKENEHEASVRKSENRLSLAKQKRPTILNAHGSRLGSALGNSRGNSRAGSRASVRSHHSRISVLVGSIERSSSEPSVLSDTVALGDELLNKDVPFISAPTTKKGLETFNQRRGSKAAGESPRISVGKLNDIEIGK